MDVAKNPRVTEPLARGMMALIERGLSGNRGLLCAGQHFLTLMDVPKLRRYASKSDLWVASDRSGIRGFCYVLPREPFTRNTAPWVMWMQLDPEMYNEAGRVLVAALCSAYSAFSYPTAAKPVLEIPSLFPRAVTISVSGGRGRAVHG